MYLEKLNWLPTNQRFKQGVTTTVFKFVQNKCSSFLNEIFRPTENIRTNTKNSYLKSHFSRQVPDKVVYLILDMKNSRNFQTRILSNITGNTTIWMISLWSFGEFDYALAIIKTIFFLLNKCFLIFFLVSLWLKYRNEKKAVRLFCVVLATLSFFSLILPSTSTFFPFSYFFIVWSFNFLYLFGSFSMAKQNLLIYLLRNRTQKNTMQSKIIQIIPNLIVLKYRLLILSTSSKVPCPTLPLFWTYIQKMRFFLSEWANFL